MNKDVYEKLKQDEHYYGEYGKQFLSNSDIQTLLKNPKNLHAARPDNPAFIVGSYFHTAILEPHKLRSFRIIDSSTRNTKKYKEMSGGEMCLLQHEADNVEKMTETILSNDMCKDLIMPLLGDVVYEEPAVKKIFGNMWKGKADIINHEEGLVIDLKTTSDLDAFRWSAMKYNYDSQAYIYSTLFDYEMVFIAIDKNTHQVGLFDCSPNFYKSGEDKVRKASDAYDLFYKTEGFDHAQHILTETL